MLTRAQQLYQIQSQMNPFLSLTYLLLILYSYLRIGLSSSVFPSRFLIKTYVGLLYSLSTTSSLILLPCYCKQAQNTFLVHVYFPRRLSRCRLVIHLCCYAVFSTRFRVSAVDVSKRKFQSLSSWNFIMALTQMDMCTYKECTQCVHGIPSSLMSAHPSNMFAQSGSADVPRAWLTAFQEGGT
jgi:hypothetical protein